MLYGKFGVLPAVTVLLLLFCVIPSFAVKAQADDDKSDKELPSFMVGGFLQQQFILDETPNSPARFSIHRARLGVKGTITDQISINLIGGYAEPPDNTPRLVNAFVDFDIHPLLQLRTGQFLLPFGLEGPEPIFLNPAIERSYAVRRLNTFTMFRDVGVQLSGHYSVFNYAVAVVNGVGANQSEQIDPKDVMGRVGFTMAENLEIGISGHVGQYQPDASPDDFESRYRAGADVSYEGKKYFVRGEYILRFDDDDQVGGRNGRKMQGGYLLGGYKFTEMLETVARYDYFDPDTDSSSDDDYLTAYTLGVNYYFVGNTRLSVNYDFRDDRSNSNLGNMLTLQMQVTL